MWRHLGAAVEHGEGGVLPAAAGCGARVPQRKLKPDIWEMPAHRRQRLQSNRICMFSLGCLLST